MAVLDEKDYLMRLIKEVFRALFSIAFGKKFVSVELERENKYEVSGKDFNDFLKMADLGLINEAENLLLDGIDYTDKEEVMAAALFYQYLSEKDPDFLTANNYSLEEVLEGLRDLMEESGYRDMFNLMDEGGMGHHE